MSRIIGIHLESHDSGVAIIDNGKIAFAANEERFSRKKMDGDPPFFSLKEAIEFTNLKYADFDVIAFSGIRPGVKKIFLRFWQQNQRVWFTGFLYLRSFLNFRKFDKERFFLQFGITGLMKGIDCALNIYKIIKLFRKAGFKGRVVFIEHDLCHAASAYFTSGFDKAFVGVIEGSSFLNSCSFWAGGAGNLIKKEEIALPHSIGRFFELGTMILGFDPKRHGGKIMGLASSGNPKNCYQKVAKLIWNDGLQVRIDKLVYLLMDQYSATKKIPDYFSGYRREDVAAAFQKRLEEIVIELLERLKGKYDLSNLALSGGVFANVKLNKEISEINGIKQVWVHPGMGDVGQALGAALWACFLENKRFLPFKLETVYFGNSYSDEDIKKILQDKNLNYIHLDNPAEFIAKELSKGKIIGLFVGRMEYGPRSLGNRSIFCSAENKEILSDLNKKLKRNDFMPFAPITLFDDRERCYLDFKKSEYSMEFMTMAVRTTPFMAERMPAVVHIDQTARPQLLKKEANPFIYRILEEHKRLTGLPSLLNTSFNIHEEPIVCRPEEALKTFLKADLDGVLLGRYFISKE